MSTKTKGNRASRALSPLLVATACAMLAVIFVTPAWAAKHKASVATNTQTSITLLGGVSTAVQHQDTTWSSSKTLKAITPSDANDGTISWTVTVTKTGVSHQTLETDGILTIQNTGSNPATVGNIVVNLQQFTKKCVGSKATYKNFWLSRAADMADADNGNASKSDNIVAAASQEIVDANQSCGAKNYTTQTILGAKALEGTFIATPGAGTIQFDTVGNTFFAEDNNIIQAGQVVTFTYQATFDNTVLKIPAGAQIRSETIVTFGNAGARGGSGASAPGFDIDGTDDAGQDDGAFVRSVPTRTSLNVPATVINCNQRVTITDDSTDVTSDQDVTVDPDTFTFTADNGDVGVSQNPPVDPTSFLIDGGALANGQSDTFTASIGYTVVNCSSGHAYNTAHLDTYQYPLDGTTQALTNPPYSWDVNGDLLLQIGTDSLGNPITVVICQGLDQNASDTENIVSGTDPATCNITPPPPPLAGYCTFVQSQWTHHPGDGPLVDLMSAIGSETIGTGGTHTATWNSSTAVENYLPAGGSNGALTATLLNPTNTSAGHVGGDILALALNVSLGTSGVLVPQNGGTAANDFGSLTICGTGNPSVDNGTVANFLSEADFIVGGGALPVFGFSSYNDLSDLATHLNVSFQQCNETGFAKNHLIDTTNPATPACP